MEIIPLNQITIPEERHRESFDEAKLAELASSISNLGNIHPPVLRNDSNYLVAGERRYRAITRLATIGISYECNGELIPPGSIAIMRLGALSPVELREAELEENLRRVDLSWQEREKAVADLHQLRLEQTGGAQTLKETAAEILGREPTGSEPTRIVRDAGIIASYLSDPDVAKAKTSEEAMKIITKKATKELREHLAEQFGAHASTDMATLTNIDAIQGMKELEPETIDVILSDPPYGIDAQNFGDQAFGDHSYDDSFATWSELMVNLAVEGYRVCKEESHVYIFCDLRNFDTLASVFNSAGFRVWSTPMIWDKGNGMLPRPNHGPRRCYEAILFASKGDKPVTAVYSDVLRIPADAKKEHAAQKPVALYEDLLRRSVLPGDTCLDPFSGSGTIFPAAKRQSCRSIGFELDPASYAIGLGRIQE